MVQNRFYAAIENCKLSQECAEEAHDEKNDQAALFSKRYRFTCSVSGNQRNGESGKNMREWQEYVPENRRTPVAKRLPFAYPSRTLRISWVAPHGSAELKIAEIKDTPRTPVSFTSTKFPAFIPPIA